MYINILLFVIFIIRTIISRYFYVFIFIAIYSYKI